MEKRGLSYFGSINFFCASYRITKLNTFFKIARKKLNKEKKRKEKEKKERKEPKERKKK